MAQSTPVTRPTTSSLLTGNHDNPAQRLCLYSCLILFSLAHRYTRDTTPHSIVYRHSDINMEALRGARCGVSDSSMVEYLRQARWSTPGEEAVRKTRQSSGPRNRARVRCDLSITGDYRFFQEVTRNVDDDSAKRVVATSLLMNYVQGASRIFQVPCSSDK